MSEEGKKSPSSQALALLYLRSKRDWSQKELAGRLGLADEKQISRYERDERPLSRRNLDTFVEALGYPPEATEALLFLDSWIEPGPLAEPSAPEPLPPEVRRAIDRSCLTLAWTFLDGWRMELTRTARKEMVARSRRKAQELWERLKPATRQERREAVARLSELQNWALAELVCHESEKAAAHKVEIALDLADLALFIARRVPGEEPWRSRLEGYCWAFIGNARRVANDLAGADRAFLQAWNSWQAGATSNFSLLSEWRLLDLEASLRRAERRFSEALVLLDRAQIAVAKDNPAIRARILLKKEHVFDQMGDTGNALATLAEVKPFVESSGDPRLLFVLLFKSANNLYHLGRYEEAAKELPCVRELAVQQGNELDLIRVVWLEARVAAGEHQRERAIVGLEQVRQDFTARGLAYDAALASLELAVLYLEEGRTAEVRDLARAMSWIFQSQGIAREALTALTLFLDAAQEETATVELTRRVVVELERMRSSAPRQMMKDQRGRAKG